jgi:hypothetical protein
MLTRESGKEGTADMLKEWLANKDRDLREREGGCWECECEWKLDGEEVELRGGR